MNTTSMGLLAWWRLFEIKDTIVKYCTCEMFVASLMRHFISAKRLFRDLKNSQANSLSITSKYCLQILNVDSLALYHRGIPNHMFTYEESLGWDQMPRQTSHKHFTCIWQLFTFCIKTQLVQYRSNVSWHSLETQTTRLDPRSLKLEYFEYRVLSRVTRVSSRVVQVSSRGNKEFVARLIFQIHVHVNLAGLPLETEIFESRL